MSITKRRLILLLSLSVFLFSLVLTAVAQQSTTCTRYDNHPLVDDITAQFDISHDEVVGVLCGGINVATLTRVLMVSESSGVDYQELLGLITSGTDWLEAMQTLNIQPADIAPGSVFGQ